MASDQHASLGLPDDNSASAKRARVDLGRHGDEQHLMQEALLENGGDRGHLVAGGVDMGDPAAAVEGEAALEAAGQRAKRGRGRPQGSKNKIAKTGNCLMPHVLTINHGEDVGVKLRELSRSYRRSLVVLAASGNLSVATLMQVGANGQGVGVTLRGHFTILSISGALLQLPADEVAALPKKAQREPITTFLSASLANPTGGVVGGTVAGPLEAAGSVTLVLGHWDPDKSRCTGLTNEEGMRLTPGGLPPYGSLGHAALLPSPLPHDLAGMMHLVQPGGGAAAAAAAASAAQSWGLAMTQGGEADQQGLPDHQG